MSESMCAPHQPLTQAQTQGQTKAHNPQPNDVSAVLAGAAQAASSYASTAPSDTPHTVSSDTPHTAPSDTPHTVSSYAIAASADAPQEECGVFGIYAPGEDVARLTFFALHALQHRGQESAGIAVGDGYTVTCIKDIGLVTQVFNENNLSTLKGDVALGHVRYSFGNETCNAAASQPHLVAVDEEIMAFAMNGVLTNPDKLRNEMLRLGIQFNTNLESEIATKLIGYHTQRTGHAREGIRNAMQLFEGAYSMAFITDKGLYAFRDPNGVHPLSIGRLPGGGWVVASETCAFDIIGAEFIRDVHAGEIVRLNEEGLTSEVGVPARKPGLCIFEFVYFARPDSIIDGMSVYQARQNAGRILAQEAPVDADIVIGVPDSGVPAAVGYALESGIPYVDGLVKNRYVGRTFIQPTQAQRDMGVRMKLNPMTTSIKGKRLIMVDDSIVRGTTSQQIVSLLKEFGATEVHVRIVSPEDKWPCFYGVDTSTQDQLISARKNVEEVRAHLEADSLAFISVDGLRRACAVKSSSMCTACFDGCYPIEVPPKTIRNAFLPNHEPHWWSSEALDPQPNYED